MLTIKDRASAMLYNIPGVHAVQSEKNRCRCSARMSWQLVSFC